MDRAALDITSAAAVKAAVAGCDVVFNCAAYNAVDAAESSRDLAFAVNDEGPGLLAAACAQAGARLVHFSTNYVFDGFEAAPYTESSDPRPLGVYARSKWAGEKRVLAALPSALVVRTSGVFAAVGSAVKGGSFPDRIVARARSGAPLRVVGDQTLNPTFAGHLALGALDLVAGDVSGVVHLVADGCCSFHEFAAAALRVAGLDSIPVEEVTSDEFPAAAPRPRNGCLTSELVAPLPSWREGLREWWAEASALSAPS